MIVNEAFVQRHWPGQDALGKRINGIDDDDSTSSIIVGVVANVRRLGATEPDAPQIYLSLAQHAERSVSYAVRTVGEPTALIPLVRETVRTLDPMLPLARVAPMTSLVDQSLAPQRFSASVLAVFGLVALTLASGGLFGVISYLVSLRQQELGVRLALGCRPRDVVALVLADGVRMAAWGIALGSGAAWLLTRALRGMLFGVGPHDPSTWIVMPVVLLLVAIIAAWAPARRASRFDPVRTLRGG